MGSTRRIRSSCILSSRFSSWQPRDEGQRRYQWLVERSPSDGFIQGYLAVEDKGSFLNEAAIYRNHHTVNTLFLWLSTLIDEVYCLRNVLDRVRRYCTVPEVVSALAPVFSFSGLVHIKDQYNLSTVLGKVRDGKPE